ncbi:phospholipase A2 [Deinococcus arenicola]|uniref:Phospholipase A2 n=1 Tax=Deinococcus arenicola TaxID=2994950 RepID=A0ABU4DPH7_9DEIO|nr:phospholipase A2 [Deinococcus sp. ZS9-10]MDV6374278.1 phospholipase A2 [Deinococcus sp. ZS9-10]
MSGLSLRSRPHPYRPVLLATLLTGCYPASVKPGDLPPGGLGYVQSVACGSVRNYEEQHARKADSPSGVDWFRNGCGDHLTLGYAAEFTSACNLHDFGYRNLRLHAAAHTGASRKVTDDALSAHMHTICAPKESGQRQVCDWTASALYGFVRVFGGFYFGGVW